MKEARLIVPAASSEGKLLRPILDQIRQDLLKEFGGYTETLGQGAWQDDTGARFIEPVHTFDIAMEETGANYIILCKLARRICETAKQQAVYVRLASGEVTFITP